MTQRYSLLQGDCLEVMRDIPAGSVDAVICDLPYGTTACKWDAVIPFAPLWEAYRRLVKPNGAIVLTASQPFTSALITSNLEWFRYCWVWQKNRATGHLDCKKKPLKEHEDIAVFYAEQCDFHPQMHKGFNHSRGGASPGPAQVWGKFADRKTTQHSEYYPKSILSFPGVQCPVHPTQKPESLMRYLVLTYTNAGETVLDNTAGSGTTGVACLQTGRKFIGIEKDPDYFCIAQKRLRDVAAQELLPFDAITQKSEEEEKPKQVRQMNIFDFIESPKYMG